MSEGETGDEDVDEDMGAMLHQHYDTEMEEDEVLRVLFYELAQQITECITILG